MRVLPEPFLSHFSANIRSWPPMSPVRDGEREGWLIGMPVDASQPLHPRSGPADYAHVVLQIADHPDQTLVTYSAATSLGGP